MYQRWANSVLKTEYEYEYYSVFRKWPNMNTNNIRSSKNDQIRIRILFDLPKMTEYKYEYYSVFQKWPNMNNIRSAENDRIWIRIISIFWNQIFEYSKICKYSNILEYSNKIRIMAIFLNLGLFFVFAELSLAPTPVLDEPDLSFSFNLSNHPSIHPITYSPTRPGKLQRS